MSIESLQPNAFDSAPVILEAVPTSIQEDPHYLYNETDGHIKDALEGARDEVVIAYRTIQSHTLFFHEEVSREVNKAVDRAKLDRILAKRERDRLVDAIEQEYQEQVAEINEDEKELLEGYEETRKNGDEFLTACARVGETILEGVAAHREKHGRLTTTIEQVTGELVQAQADIATIDERRIDKTNTREDLLRDYDATELVTKHNRRRLVELMRSSSEKTEEHYQQQRSVERGVIPLTPEAINEVMGEMQNQDFAYRQVHSDIMNRVTSIQNEIDEANIQNASRNKEIIHLRYEIDAFKAEIEGLREYSLELEAYLTQLEAMKDELAKTAALLQNRAEAVQAIARGGIGAIDSIPLELQDLVKAALGVQRNKAPSSFNTDLATAIPEMDRTVVRIAISPDIQPQANMSKIAVQAVYGEAPIVADAEAQKLSLLDTMSYLADEMNALRQWVQDSAGGLLPEAARMIPQGIMTQGMRAHVRATNE